MEKYNENERKTMVACMEYIVRNLNDEDIFMSWLMTGVADGDLSYHELSTNLTSEKDMVDDYYIEDDNFSDLMSLFLRLMARANKSGGLYCNGVVSR